MKNFFKKLAFVLALAMVVTAIAPAAKASAATEPSFKYDAKKLYLGGDVTGNYGETYRFKFNDAKGYTATWKSSNAKVATVDAKTGNIQAVAVGKATITATLTKKGSDAVELKATVYVKQNAEKVGFGKMDSVKNMAVGDTGKVNVYRQVGTTKVWKQAEKTLCTDVVKWTSSNPEVATVDKWGKVTAVAAGEATITATATQSEGSKAVVSKSYTVKVAAGLVDAKQASATKINVTFAGDLSAVVTKDNLFVNCLVGSTETKVVVKEVKFDDTDKTKAVVTVYTNFEKDKEYTVKYGDTQASFKGADLSKDAVESIAITTVDAVKYEATKIEIKAYDKNGIDLTTDEILGYVDVSAPSSSDYYLDTANKTITFYSAGKSATVTAKFHTYKYGTDFKEITKDATGTIVSKDKAALTIKKIDAFTVYNTENPDFTKLNSTLSISDADAKDKYKVAVKTTTSEDKELLSTATGSKITFESSDKTTLLVADNVLYPLKEGGAVIIVKYDNVAIGSYPVTIGAKRAASEVTAAFDKTNLSAGRLEGVVIDSVKLTVTTKDQFGADRTGVDSIEVTFVTGPKGGYEGIPGATGAKKNEFVFNDILYTVEGTYQYKVKVGEQIRYVSFEVKKAGTDVSNYQLDNRGKTVDTALKVGDANNTDKVDFTLNLASYASNGYKIANIPMTDKATATKITSGSAVYVEVSAPAGKSADDIKDFVSITTGGSVSVTPIIGTSEFKKAPVGTYAVNVFEVTFNDKGEKVVKAITSTNFVIIDTQKAAEVSVNSTVSKHSDVVVALKDKDDVVTIKIDGKEYNSNVLSAETIGTGKELSVTKAKVKVDVQYGEVKGYFVQEVVIGATITLK